MRQACVCQKCGIEAPTRSTRLRSNIGLLLLRIAETTQGELCRRCIAQTFWKYTGTNLLLGWWSLHSLVLTPIYLVDNLAQYMKGRRLPAIDRRARHPVLDEQTIEKLRPLGAEMLDRLARGEEPMKVATDLAERAQVRPGQVLLFIGAVSMQAKKAA